MNPVVENQALARIEQARKRGEHGRAIFLCDELLANPAHKALRPVLLYRKGQSHEALGHAWHGAAISCYRESYAEAGKEQPLKARLIVELGKIYCATGDWRSFEPYVQKFERMARSQEPEVVRWGPHVWYNFGCGLDTAREWDPAAEAFTKAISLADQLQNSLMEAISHHNLGGVRLDQGHLPEAEAAMTRAEAMLPPDQWGHKLSSRRAEYYLAIGDLANAQSMVTAALTHPMVDGMTRSDVTYTWARVLLALGRKQEAREKAMLALDLAVKAVHYPGIHKTTRLLQELNEPELES